MSEEEFIISVKPYTEEEGFPEEIKEINEWRFNCDRPLEGENSESRYMLNWFVHTTDNQFIYQGKIREGYVYESLSENNSPSLEMTMNFVKDQLISRENFPENCVFTPYVRQNINNLMNIGGLNINSPLTANLFLRLLGGSGINSLLNSPIDSALNESFIQELERAINQKKPTSKEAIEKLEILTVDENLLKQYISEDSVLKEEVKSKLSKETDKQPTDEEIYKKVLNDWREKQSNGIRCAMCMEFVKTGDKVVRLPCTDKEGNKTPHYFHYVEDNGKGEPEKDVCVGFGIMEWLKDQNTCPCCRFELPLEKEIPENKKNVNISEPSETPINNQNSQPSNITNINSTYQEDLLRSILGLVANNVPQTNHENCQCQRCVERRQEQERLENMTEEERLEDQLLREALRRSENISEEEEVLDRTHEGIGGNMMTEEEAIEAAIRASLQEN
jgi:hypothetical protein